MPNVLLSRPLPAKPVALLLGLFLGCLLLFALTACGHDNLKDLKNVPNGHPDYILNVENMDGHPNIGVLCIKGAGFATTTRSYDAITRVPEWDAFCQSAAK